MTQDVQEIALEDVDLVALDVDLLVARLVRDVPGVKMDVPVVAKVVLVPVEDLAQHRADPTALQIAKGVVKTPVKQHVLQPAILIAQVLVMVKQLKI